MNVQTAKARTIKEAHGAICRDCDAIFDTARCQYWHWSKSKWMHEDATGHRMDLWKIVGFAK